MSIDSLHIPMFPLNTMLLPGEQLPLHIFEKRYRQLFDEVEASDLHFALPYKDSGLRLASKCRLVRVTKRLPSGARDVIIECLGLHELVSTERKMPNKLYPGGIIGALVFDKKVERASVQLLEQFADYIEIKFGKRPILAEIMHYRPVDVAACVALSNEEKVRFVKCENEKAREALLYELLKYLHFLYYQEAQAENGILLN